MSGFLTSSAHRPSRCAVYIACLILAATLLPAQNNTGELRLTITDKSGAPVEATAELVNEAIKVRQTVDVPAGTRYSFKNLQFGKYVLRVTREGFQPSAQTVNIESAVPLRREVRLVVSPLKTSVEVTDAETLMNTERTAATYYTSAQEVQERPMGQAGRGLIDLAVRQPGWTLEANGILHPRESEYDTQFVVNGFPVQDNRSPAFARPFEADDVVSIKQYTSGIPAEFGNKLGGVIELNTSRNLSPGFHGVYVGQGGSFDTLSSYASGQYVWRDTSLFASAEGFFTDRYLDPPTEQNYTNHASSRAFNVSLDHDFNQDNRVRISVIDQRTRLEVPNDLLQQEIGQRQDRTSGSTEGQVSYQHIFSPSLIGSVRGSIRNVSAALWSNPLSSPILGSQDRNYREGYWDASLAGHAGSHEWKAGTQGRYASVDEKFGYDLVSYEVEGEPVFDDDLPASYRFSGHRPDREQAVYAQDIVRMKNFTFNLGLRFDHYDFLVNETAWSPRLGVAYSIQPLSLVLHASYDRTFGTPPFENLLVSSAPSSRFEEGFYLPLRPSRGNYYEVGLQKAFGRYFRLDANWFRRDVDNFEDDDLLLNTGVSFPIAFRRATIKGTEVKLEVPRWGRFSGFLSYANTTGLGRFPITGGLFLEDEAEDLLNATYRFPISQDIRNAANLYVRYQVMPRLWTAWSASYTSGLPIEEVDELPDEDLLVAQYGSEVVKRANLARGRVRPSFFINASAGVDLHRGERTKVSLQGDVINIGDRMNLINFDGLLSGTALGLPRTASVRLRVDF